MMNRTAKHLEDIRNIMNTSEAIQAEMDKLARKAEEKNITEEQWADFKTRLMTSMFYKMAEMMPELKQDLCEDIYEELRA